jgi:hypothetical protein
LTISRITLKKLTSMNPKVKSAILWTIAVVMTVGAAVYQKKTGPTYPLSGDMMIGDQNIHYSLIRSYNTGSQAAVKILAPDTTVKGEIKFRRFRSYDKWTVEPMFRSGDTLVGLLPGLPPAGKVMYLVTLSKGETAVLLNHDPAVLRYKGAVPGFILIPHIFFIFFAMLLSTRAGLEALTRGRLTYVFTWFAVIFLAIGGLILGPFVQKYAFDAYWTGWPFGHDLTDNKSLVAFIFWIIALFVLFRNREKRTWAVVAAIVTLVVFLIPHSMLGSEIDYTKEAPKTELPK